MLTIGFATVVALSSALRARSLRRCTQCQPRCPNRHQIQIAGNQGMFIVAIGALLTTLAEAAIKAAL